MNSPDSSPPDRFLTVSQVAEKLSVSPSLVYQMIEAGKLAHHRVGTGRGTIRISQSDLDAYLSACRSEVEERQLDVRNRRPRLKHIRL